MVRLESIRQQLAQVLHLQETPHRTALAFAIGVFIAFAPHYFFHIASVVFCAWAFRLNYLALFVGSFINNPWTVVPILAASLYTGLLLVGESSSTSIEWENMSVDNMFEILSPYLFPFIVGACTLAILGSLISYPVMRWAITRYREFKHT
jgi:uncharacterized protein (DUF2062 family)